VTRAILRMDVLLKASSGRAEAGPDRNRFEVLKPNAKPRRWVQSRT
jgi:hypothetical protein